VSTWNDPDRSDPSRTTGPAPRTGTIAKMQSQSIFAHSIGGWSAVGESHEARGVIQALDRQQAHGRHVEAAGDVLTLVGGEVDDCRSDVTDVQSRGAQSVHAGHDLCRCVAPS